MDTCISSWLLKLLAAQCFLFALIFGGSERAATQTASAQTSSCPHSLDKWGHPIWRPTDLELHLMLARHRGWLETQKGIDLRNPDPYLDRVDPDWRSKALDHPYPDQPGPSTDRDFVNQ